MPDRVELQGRLEQTGKRRVINGLAGFGAIAMAYESPLLAMLGRPERPAETWPVLLLPSLLVALMAAAACVYRGNQESNLRMQLRSLPST